MLSSFKLPLSFDAHPLKSDLGLIQSDEWSTHFNTQYFEGEWTGVALRSVNGLSTQLYPDAHAAGPVKDTAILERCSNIDRALASFECPIRSARLLKLAPGSHIQEHRDYDLSFEDGEIRLHIPIITSPEVEFFLDGYRIEMNAGECWYLDLNLPHAVINRSSIDRIHLVIDCEVNDWLRELLVSASAENSETAPAAPAFDESFSRLELERFRQHVLENIDLQEKLRDTIDHRVFVRSLVETGRDRGFQFSESAVEEALKIERRAWLERWIE